MGEGRGKRREGNGKDGRRCNFTGGELLRFFHVLRKGEDRRANQIEKASVAQEQRVRVPIPHR